MRYTGGIIAGRVVASFLKGPHRVNQAIPHCRTMANNTTSNNLTDVQASQVNTKRIITLSRPKALNALSLPMIQEMYPLVRNLDNPKVDMIIIKGDGGKAFCAGGDVRSITEAGKVGGSLAQDFFREEYNLNYSLGTCPVPVVALIDGITMGGGVGISVHGPFRVATERTLFAMPETAIGLFPDVGGSHFMPRMRGKLGLYLALTGCRLKGRNCVDAGIATHFVDSQLMKEVEAELLAIKSENVNKNSIEQVLSKYHKKCTDGVSHPFSLQPYLEKIDKLFNAKSLEEIWQNLEKDGSAWAMEQLAIMKKMSPTSMKVSMRQLEYGAKLDLKECLKMEYRMSQHFIADHDFYEGVRAVLVDKDNAPQWKPAKMEEVTEEKVEWFFSHLEPSKEMVIADYISKSSL